MARESCENCIYYLYNPWVKPALHMCMRTMEVFAVRPSSIPPCIAYKPKPEYVPKESEEKFEGDKKKWFAFDRGLY